MAFRILFVCSANRCRSPAAMALTRDRLAAAGLDKTVTTDSAGIEVDAKRPWCDEARQWVESEAKAPPAVDARVSRALTRSATQRADLILSLDRSCNAAVLRLNPAARGKTFLLREAALLGRAVVVAAGLEDGQAEVVDPAHPLDLHPKPASRMVEPVLQWWVGEMDAARGRVPLGRPRRLLPRRQRDVELGIPDAHGRRSKAGHAKVLHLLSESVDDFMETLVYALEPRGL